MITTNRYISCYILFFDRNYVQLHMNLYRLLLISIFFITILRAQTIDISVIDKPTNILMSTEIFIDKENKQEFDYIQKNSANLFIKNRDKQIRLGYSEDAVWLKFRVKNNTDKSIKRVLEISNNMLDEVVLYTKSKDKYTKEVDGTKYYTFFNENILRFYFEISINKGEIKEYYLKASSLTSALYFELNLMNKDELYQKEIEHQLILSLFFAGLLTLVIYNLSIFMFTKDKVYLYYSLYQFSLVWNHLSFSSMLCYVASADFNKMDIYFTIYYLSFLSIWALLFTREFLGIKKYKKIDFVFKIFLLIDIIFIVVASEFYYYIDIVTAISLLSLLNIIGVSFYLYFKGNTNAKFMVIGWSIAIFGWLMLATKQYGLYSLINTYPYFYEAAMFTEALLFSIALAKKLNTTKELERSVNTNTVLTRELHHRVKNNMQFIISMYRLKLAKYTNVSILNSLKEVEGTIQAMSATHEMLYSQEIVSHLDTKEYFTTLIERLKSSYESSNIEIKLEVNSSLDIDNSIYVGIILNELITNSFKYAFKENRGKIKITLSTENYKKCLIIQDNGIGYDPNMSSDSFGLELVQTLVEDELNGVITTVSSAGVIHTIVWK